MEKPEMLRLENISKSFASNHVLKDINFSINRGEVRALVGENGAGKSTLIKIIAGASKPNNGKVYIDGEEVTFESPRDGRNKGIAVIYQELDLLPELTVIENIFLGIEIKNNYGLLDKKAMEDKADSYLADMNLPHIDKYAKVGDLPIASQQMIAITKAFASKAKILIMDEPSSSLTSSELIVLFDQIRNLKEKNVTVIYISHRLEEIFEICDSVTILRDGMMIATNTVESITRKEIIELMIGKKVSENRLNSRLTYDAPNILEVENLCLDKVLHSVSFSVKKGEIYGILGLLGSGFIELGKVMYGARKPTSGTIKINGKTLELKSPSDALENSIAYVTDERRGNGLFMEMDVQTNTIITSVSKFRKKSRILDHKGMNVAFMEYVNKFEIKIDGKDQKVQFLSGGNQQKILIARTILRDTDLIILSCPTKGIDVGSKYDIYQILLDCAKQGKTVIAISQEIPELVQICDRIMMMKRGQVYKEYSGDEISETLIYNDLLAK